MWRPYIKSAMNLALVFALSLSACKEADTETEQAQDNSETVSVPWLSYTFHKAHPHDVTAFTEGLLVHEGRLWESTGSPDDMPQTRSLFGIVDSATGRILVKAELDRNRYFGEGITILNGKVYQLTYQTKIGFIYDLKTLKQTGEFVMPGVEGWGLTTDGSSLIMSEGTNRLIYIDPNTMKATRTLNVTDNYGAVTYLNELEFVDGYIYANKYGSDLVVKIDTASGKVVGRIDFARLAGQARQANHASLEMNGIAYDPDRQHFFITGKMWPYIFEVSIP